MAEIMIRDVSRSTKELLRRRAKRHGKALEAHLRETLEQLAKEEQAKADEEKPLGAWMYEISRPGVDLDDILRELRSAPVRHVDFS